MILSTYWALTSTALVPVSQHDRRFAIAGWTGGGERANWKGTFLAAAEVPVVVPSASRTVSSKMEKRLELVGIRATMFRRNENMRSGHDYEILNAKHIPRLKMKFLSIGHMT